jgi:radical SAM superfamily enzyme YgiQ (UPF0313 family)
MISKKVLHMVQANDVIATNVILPLALGILWQNAIANSELQKKWQLGEVVYKKEDIDSIASVLADGDLVCFSNYLWNCEYHLALAAKIKSINPGIFILIGGPDVSPKKTNLFHYFEHVIDLAIVGEGEQSFIELLRTFPCKTFDHIPGAWTKDFFRGESERSKSFPINASPYINGFYDKIVAKEIYSGNKIQAVVQTNRGCPYRCTFCEEGSEYKNKMFFYDEIRVKQELEWCAKNKVEYLSIADDNWGIAPIDVEYFRHIRNLKLKYGYPEVVDATYAKNASERLLELADIDAEYNTNLIRGFTIALQSLNANTLKSIKRFNLVPQKQLDLIQGLKQRNMPTYTEIIWPLPYENYDTFRQGLDKVLDLGLDNWMGVYTLVIQEGTELYEEFIEDYKFVKQQSHNDNKKSTKNVGLVNAVNESIWVDRKTIVRGQLLYTWLAVLFFFGFARPILTELKIRKETTICTIIDKFLTFLYDNPDLKISKFNNKIDQWWTSWYQGDVVPDISLFPKENTDNWSPYAHLSSYIQNEFETFQAEFSTFVEQQYESIGPDVLQMNYHSVVRFQQQYPLYNKKYTVHTATQIPKFDSLFKFCRYFYWWKRKNGWHRTVIEKI